MTEEKHSGSLDDYEIAGNHAEVFLFREGIYIESYPEGGSVYLVASQALSLLAYLKQEEETLQKILQRER